MPPPDRYDWRRYKLLRISGSTPVTDPNDVTATEVTVPNGSTRTTASFSESPPSDGIWSYSLFSVYDEYGTSTDERFSAADTITVMSGWTATPTPTPTPTPPTPTPSPTPTPLAADECKVEWTPPPDRYDWRRYKVLRVSGSTATTDPDDATATEISITGATTRTTSSFIDDPGSGTWSYSVFCVYDEYGTATDERYSDPLTLTVTVT